ncbi:MAG TPA: hypothetical protein VIO14_00380 [Dehalococcoidia bacterium]
MRSVELRDGRVFRLEPGLEDRIPPPESSLAWCAVCQRPAPVRRRGQEPARGGAVRRDGRWYCPEHAPRERRARPRRRGAPAA